MSSVSATEIWGRILAPVLVLAVTDQSSGKGTHLFNGYERG